MSSDTNTVGVAYRVRTRFNALFLWLMLHHMPASMI